MRLPVLISVCLSLDTRSLCGHGAEVSHNRDLPPLRLAAADLDTILHKTHSVIAAANGSFRRARGHSGECEAWGARARDRDTALLHGEQRCVPEGSLQVFLHLLPTG